MKTYDVIVVGAGTGGSYLSYLLSKRGFDTLLFESRDWESIGVKACGDGLGKHHVDRMSIKPPQRIFVNSIDGVELYSPSEKTKYVLEGKGYVLDRFAWGRWLVEEAVNAGTTLLYSHVVLAPILERGAVVGVRALDVKSRSVKEFRARVVVDASGASAVVRTKLPSEWPVAERLEPFDVQYAYREIVELEDEVPDHDYIKIFLNQEIAPGGYWWLFPKSPNLVNVGLGTWGRLGLNAVNLYRRYVRSRFKVRKVLHSGGGIVPTRRPLKSLVGDGVLAIGDAAVAVNPIHGGGIGQALLSSELAAKAIEGALERGDYSASSLWSYNVEYMKVWGYKQAQLDLWRLMLQTLSNGDLEFGLRARLLSEMDIYDVASKGVKDLSLADKLRALARLLGRPALLHKLMIAVEYSKRIGDIYTNYPQTPERLERWYVAVAEVYRDFLNRIGLVELYNGMFHAV